MLPLFPCAVESSTESCACKLQFTEIWAFLLTNRSPETRMFPHALCTWGKKKGACQSDKRPCLSSSWTNCTFVISDVLPVDFFSCSEISWPVAAEQQTTAAPFNSFHIRLKQLPYVDFQDLWHIFHKRNYGLCPSHTSLVFPLNQIHSDTTKPANSSFVLLGGSKNLVLVC